MNFQTCNRQVTESYVKAEHKRVCTEEVKVFIFRAIVTNLSPFSFFHVRKTFHPRRKRSPSHVSEKIRTNFIVCCVSCWTIAERKTNPKFLLLLMISCPVAIKKWFSMNFPTTTSEAQKKNPHRKEAGENYWWKLKYVESMLFCVLFVDHVRLLSLFVVLLWIVIAVKRLLCLPLIELCGRILWLSKPHHPIKIWPYKSRHVCLFAQRVSRQQSAMIYICWPRTVAKWWWWVAFYINYVCKCKRYCHRKTKLWIHFNYRVWLRGKVSTNQMFKLIDCSMCVDVAVVICFDFWFFRLIFHPLSANHRKWNLKSQLNNCMWQPTNCMYGKHRIAHTLWRLTMMQFKFSANPPMAIQMSNLLHIWRAINKREICHWRPTIFNINSNSAHTQKSRFSRTSRANERKFINYYWFRCLWSVLWFRDICFKSILTLFSLLSHHLARHFKTASKRESSRICYIFRVCRGGARARCSINSSRRDLALCSYEMCQQSDGSKLHTGSEAARRLTAREKEKFTINHLWLSFFDEIYYIFVLCVITSPMMGSARMKITS